MARGFGDKMSPRRTGAGCSSHGSRASPTAHFSVSGFQHLTLSMRYAASPIGMNIRECSFGIRLLPDRLDVGIDSHDDGLAVDCGFGFLVAVAACDRERLAGGGRARRVQRDFDVEDVVLDGGFHG